MNQFTIAEFEDGLQLVPSIWLQGTSECLWPTHGNIKRLHKYIAECEEPDYETWEIVKVIRIFGTANSYENGMRKVKLAEHFSDIDSSDIDVTSKKTTRRIRAKKTFDSDGDDNDLENVLPPPPKKPVVKPFTKQQSITNVMNNKEMQDLSPLQNKATRKHFDEDMLQSVPDIVKKRPTEASVLQSNNKAILTDIEFKQELLRKYNKIDAKLDRVDDRLNRFEQRLETVISYKKEEYLDITEVVSFPLKTKEALNKFELDLQNTNILKNMVTFMKQLGGKTYEEQIVIILKHTISNFLSTLYCWHGRDGKKAAFKNLLFVKCIKQCVYSKFESTNDQQITHVISKWLVQGKLRHNRDVERLQRTLQEEEEEEEV